MHDDIFPIDPPHFLAAGLDLSKTHRLLLYRGPMTGRWFDVTTTRVPGPGSSGSQEPVTTTEPQRDVVGLGEVILRLTPDPHIDWFFKHNGLGPVGQWPVMIPPSSLSGEFATRAGPDGPADISHGPTVWLGNHRIMSAIQIGDPEDHLNEIRFYLVNFQVWFLTEDVQRNGENDRRSGIRLQVDDWRVDIERRSEFSDVMCHLEEQRGYGVTHICRVWREGSDGSRSSFTFREAKPVLEAVKLFASFVRGGMVGIALPVGYKNNISVIEEWHVTAVDPGRYPDPHRPWPLPGWYPLYRPPGYEKPHPATWLAPLFERFASRFLHRETESRKFWQSLFRELIYTYTDAERLAKERAIVPACTALETLGWAILVVQEKWLTGDRHPDRGQGGYERLTATDRLRLLLNWAGLATAVPASLAKMLGKSKASGNWDSANLITWTRNRVVHPDRHGQLIEGLASETWMVAMWYTELIILKLLGYDGYFRNRLNQEAVERVPWAGR